MFTPIGFVLACVGVAILLHVCMQSAATPCTPPPRPARGYEFYPCPEPPKEIKLEFLNGADDGFESEPAGNDPDLFRALHLDELVEGRVYRIETIRTAHGRVKTNWRVMRFLGFEACGRKQGVLLHFGLRASTKPTTIANSDWCIHSHEAFAISLMRAEA